MGFEKCKSIDSVFKELNKMIDNFPVKVKKQGMTWPELCEKAKEFGAFVHGGCIFYNGHCFYKTNKECVLRDKNNVDKISIYVKSYDKMLMIMEALK